METAMRLSQFEIAEKEKRAEAAETEIKEVMHLEAS